MKLILSGCISLEALPNTITTLPSLQFLFLAQCSPLLKLLVSFRHMTCVCLLDIDLTTKWQVVHIGQLNELKWLWMMCGNEANTLLDSLDILKNLKELILLTIFHSPSMTKLPKTNEFLTNLRRLELLHCKKFHIFPTSFGQLNVLRLLLLYNCTSLESCLILWVHWKI